MLIYQGTKKKFNDDVVNNVIAEKLEEIFKKEKIGGGSQAEIRSWRNSLSQMEIVLQDEGIPLDCQIALEYKIPTTCKRIDFMIAGKDDKDINNIYVIELKQWEEAIKTDFEDCVQTYVGKGERVLQHPCCQVYNYTKLLENINEEISDKGIQLHPACYLHNFKAECCNEIKDKRYEFYIKQVPLFLSHDAIKLREFFKKNLKKKPDENIFEVIDQGKLKPSKSLQDAILPMLEGKKEFYMIDEQQVAYSTILKTVREALKEEKKCTIIVQGGPGTGKTVIAISLLARLIKEGVSTSYVSKNSAPRNVYGKLLIEGDKKKSYIQELLKGSGCFIGEKNNRYDCLLVDEAHRLNEKTGPYKNQGENQIKEIIHASRVSVFFLDEDQIVHIDDIGSVEEIKKWAKEEGSIVITGKDFVLTSQFRCNGSNAYIAFLDNLLQIRKTANESLEGLDFDFRIFDDPNEMKEELRKKNFNNKARIVAGYTHPWNSKHDTSKIDIVLKNGFQARWNFSATTTWAIDKDSFEEIGCIHTCQGLELDYIGVIIGKDLIYRNGNVITDYTKRCRKFDKSLNGIDKRKDAKQLADKIIKDTYKVLLTRGQKGCYVYCEDEELSQYIKKQIKKEQF